MKNINNFLILDTETTVKAENMPFQSVFDIGWTISTRDGEILTKRSYLVEEFRDMALYSRKAFLINNGSMSVKTYFNHLVNKTIKVAKWKSIQAQLSKDCKKYNVEYIGAYNLAFDTRVISNTSEFFSEKEFTFFDDYFLIDLYPLATKHILNNEIYLKFADKHDLKTEKGNYKTSVESTYKFITNDPSYEEEHTACVDSQHETKILHHILNLNKEIPLQDYKINGQAWRILNSEENEILENYRAMKKANCL